MLIVNCSKKVSKNINTTNINVFVCKKVEGLTWKREWNWFLPAFLNSFYVSVKRFDTAADRWLKICMDNRTRFVVPARYHPWDVPPLTAEERQFVYEPESRDIVKLICRPYKNSRRSMEFDLIHPWYMYRTQQIPVFVFNYVARHVTTWEHGNLVVVRKVLTMTELLYLKEQGVMRVIGPFFHPNI